MPIPTDRSGLERLVSSSFLKLQAELDVAGSRAGSRFCTDEWTVKELLAVRAWWTGWLADRIEATRRGEVELIPAKINGWQAKRRINDDIVKAARKQAYRSVRADLEKANGRLLRAMGLLGEGELFEPGIFTWTGKDSVAKWISTTTASQYAKALTGIRRALREYAEQG